MAVAIDHAAVKVQREGVKQRRVVGGEQDAQRALLHHTPHALKECFCPAGVDTVVHLLDDHQAPFRNRVEGRCHGQHAQRSVRKDGRIPRFFAAAEPLGHADHHIIALGLDEADGNDLAFWEVAHEVEHLFLVALTLAHLVQHGRQVLPAGVQHNLLLDGGVPPHERWAWFEEENAPQHVPQGVGALGNQFLGLGRGEAGGGVQLREHRLTVVSQQAGLRPPSGEVVVAHCQRVRRARNFGPKGGHAFPLVREPLLANGEFSRHGDDLFPLHLARRSRHRHAEGEIGFPLPDEFIALAAQEPLAVQVLVDVVEIAASCQGIEKAQRLNGVALAGSVRADQHRKRRQG